MLSYRGSLCCLGVVALFACKQPSGNIPTSSTSSLDNFSGASLTTNVCQGSGKVVAKATQVVGSEQYKSTINRVLSAVPLALQNAFFRDMRGRLILTEDIANDCHNSTDTTLISCWQIVGGTPAIFVKQETAAGSAQKNTVATEENINHATLRAFAYFLSEFLVKLDSSGQNLVENEVFTSFKSELGLALVQDVAAGASKGYRLAAFSNFLPPSILGADVTPAKRTEAWKTLPPDVVNRFGDLALAEAYDSLHCSGETTAKLRSDFTGVEPIIVAASREIDAGLNGDVSGGSGMNLYGRWGAGNGPVRQGLRNWSSFRRSGGGAFNFRRAANGGGFIGRRRIFGR